MQLTSIITKQQARTMVAVTRKGDTQYIAGSKGITYPVTRFVDSLTGQISYECTCVDYTGCKDGNQFRPSKRSYLELCKHGKVAEERDQ